MSNIFVFRQPPLGFINEYFGGGKGGSTTTTNNVTQIPPEVLARYNSVNARAEKVADQPYQSYSNDPNAFVAPLNATQQAGIQNTNIMAGAAQPYYSAATNQLMQAQAGAQPGINAAYQNVGQAQNQGQQYLGAATQNVGQAQNQGQQYLGAATAASQAGAQAVDPSQLNINQYMNPFTQNVVNATQAAMNQQQGQQLSQQQAEAIRGGAFGGDRANLQRGQLMGQQSLAQSQAIAPLYQQNYQQALAAAQQQQGVGLGAGQANRAAIQNYAQQLGNLGQQGYQQGMGAAQQYGALGQQGYQQGIGAAQQLAALAQQGYGMGAGTSAALAGLGTNAQQAGLAGAQAQLAAGQTQQQTQQAGLQALYNQFQQKQGFPYQQAQFLANIAEGTGALSGNATSGTSTTTGGGGFFSDERLKENIQKVGETNDGQPIYRYNYKGDKNTQIGLLAQDVEKKHPDAVGLAGGYKTVNYKKATEDAVHKADGGAAGDAYSMGAPSQMLQENSGKGLGAVPTLPQMVTGRGIPIQAGANASDVAAMRAPEVTGFAPGVREGKQAELASLQSTLANPGPNANQLGSGPDYLQNRIGTLQDWLSKNAPSGTSYSAASSQGGLVSQPGNFAQGGLAGGYADGGYMNPALQYYAPSKGDMMAMGPYGVAPRQSQQRQLLQGTKFDRPAQQPQRSAIDEATKIGQLGSGASSAWNARPDFLRSAADVAARQQTADAIKAKELLTIEQAKGLGAGTTPASAPTVDGKSAGLDLGSDTRMAFNDDFYMPDMAARGGLIGDRHHYSRGGINPYGSPDGSNDILGPIIEEQDVGRRIPNDKGTPAPSPKQQESGGLGDVMKAKSIYDMGDKALKGGQWAAGKLGLGGPETAMSATSTEAIPGVAGGVVPETVAPVVPEAVTAAAPEALAAAAPEAIGAGVAGGAEAAAAAAAAAEAAAAASAADFLPFLLLKRGGVVPRHHFLGGGFESGTTPRSAPFAGDAGGTEMTDEDKANALVKQLAGQTIAEKAPLMERRPVAPVAPVEAPAAPSRVPSIRPVTGEVPVARAPFQHFASKILPDDMGADTKAALTSENLWVPALAGIGSMMASPNKTLAGAIGSGLVGGTSAYTGLQGQQADIAKKEMDTEAVRAGIAAGSIFTDSKGRQFVRYIKPDGTYGVMEGADWWDLPEDQRPRIDPAAERLLSETMRNRSAKKTIAPPGAISTTPPAAAKTPATPAPIAEAAPAAPAAAPAVSAPVLEVAPEAAIKVPDELKTTAREKAKALYRAGTGAETAYPDVTTPAITAAAAAQNQKPQLGSLANSLAGSPRTESGLASGKVQEIAQPIMAVASNLASMFGLPAPIPQGDMSKSELIKKSLTSLAAEATKSNNQTAAASFNEMANAIPNNLNSPDAQAKMLADIFAINQRIIDRGSFHSQVKDAVPQRYIGQAPHAASAANVDAEFNKAYSPAFYNTEKQALVKMFHEGPTGQKNAEGRQMSWHEFLHDHGAELTQKQRNQIAKQLGAPNVMRYFGLGE